MTRTRKKLCPNRALLVVVVLVAGLHMSTGNLCAQQPAQTSAADTSSPRDTLRSFIDAGNELVALIKRDKFFDESLPEHRRVAERMLDCLDLSEIPLYSRQEMSGEVAVCLKEILDREELPAWEEIPGTPEIEAAGGYESLSIWRIPGTRITIARVVDGPRKHEYLFSTGTVARAVDYFESVEPLPYRTTGPVVSPRLHEWYFTVPGNPRLAALVETMPENMRNHRTLGVASWKWPAILIALVVSAGLIFLAWWLQWKISSRIRVRRPVLYGLSVVFSVFAVFVPIGLQHFVDDYLSVRGDALYILSFLISITLLLTIFVLVFGLLTRMAEAIIATPWVKRQSLNAELIRIVFKLLTLVAWVAVFVAGGQYLGVPIGTLLASAGIFGAAIALASQDILKSLFGTITLLGDKPFRVGDFIKVGDYEGTVEDIGLRSTKLRLLAGHCVRIPNDQVANQDVENITNREYIRRQASIYLPLDTTREKVEKAVATVREKLDQHENEHFDRPARVVLEEFDSSGFCIRFWYWFSTPDIWECREFNSRINLEIFREFERQQITYSLPLRHTYWKHDHEQGPLEINIQNPNPAPD